MMKSVAIDEKKIQASDVLAVDSNILMCALLDLKGKTTSYAETEKWKFARIPKDEIGERALLSHLVIEGMPRELGKIRYKVVFTDTMKLISMRLGSRIALFTLPKTIPSESICEDVLRRFGLGISYEGSQNAEAAQEFVYECQNCGRRLGVDHDPKAEAYLIDVQENINGEVRTIQTNVPIMVCTKCKKMFGKPRYLFRGKVKFEDWHAQ